MSSPLFDTSFQRLDCTAGSQDGDPYPAGDAGASRGAPADVRLDDLLRDVDGIAWEADATGTFRYVSAGAEAILGYAPDEWLTDPEFLHRRLHPQDRDRVLAQIDEATRSGGRRELEFRMIAADGRTVWLRDCLSARAGAGGTVLRGLMTDATGQKRSEQRITTRDAVTRVLAECESLEVAARRIVEAIGRGLDWDEGAFWVLDEHTGVLRCVDFWRAGPGDGSRLEDMSRRMSFGRGVGLPGLVWETRRPLWLPDLAADTGFVCSRAASSDGVHSAFACPIQLRDRVLGVVEFFSRDVRAPDDDLIEMMTNIASQIGQFVERTRALVAVTQSEQRFRAMANGASVLMWLAGPDGGCTFFNDPWLAFTGRALEPSLGYGWLDALHPDDADRWLIAYAAALAARRRFQIEFRLRDAAGGYRWVLDTGAPLFTSQGEFAGYIGSCVDITERRDAEDAMIESEERFRLLAQNASDVIYRYRFKPDRGFDYVSPAVTALTGYTPEEHYDDPMLGFKLVHPDDRDLLTNMHEQTNEQQGGPLELRWVRRDGQVVWVEQRNVPVRDESGEVVAIEGIARDITRRKLDEQALERSERRYRTLTESIPALMITSDADGRVSYFNRRWVEYLGLDRPEVAPEALSRSVHPEDIRGVADQWKYARGTGAAAEGEFRIRAADGIYRWHFGRIAPMKDASGAVTGWIGTAIEIDDRKRAEQQVSELNAVLRRRVGELETVLDVVPVGIGIAEDPSCKFIRMNRAFARLLNMPHHANSSKSAPDGEELPFAVRRGGRDVPEAELPMRQAAATGRPVDGVVFEVQRRDEAPVNLLEYAAPLFGEGDEVVGSVGVFVDITDRQRREDAQQFVVEASSLLASTLDYESALRDLATMAVPRIADICTVDLIGRGGEARRLKTACADPEKVALVERLRVRGWLSGPELARRLGDVLPLGEHIFVREITDGLLELVTPDERTLHNARALGARSAIIVPLHVRGKLFGVFGFATAESGRRYDEQDLALATELAHRAAIAIENARLYAEAQRTTEDLRRANAAKDEFLGLVSHELRTPITTIYGNAEVLRKLGARIGEEDRRLALRDIEQESARLARLVDNIFVLARIESGREVQVEPQLLHRVVDRLVAAHRQHYPRRSIENFVDPDMQPVLAEPTYLDQILRNLLSNAEKYSPEATGVEVHAQRTGDEVRIEVLDRGSGIRPQEVERIFTAFYRSPSTRDEAAGTGIGLAVCRRLVEAQGGRIEARPRDGGGTAISFTLPIEKENT